MLKLFVTVLVLSTSGGVSTSLVVTDMQDGIACGKMEKVINESPPTLIPGRAETSHTATMTMKAKCVSDGPINPEVAIGKSGAPIAREPDFNDIAGGLISRFGRSIQQVR